MELCKCGGKFQNITICAYNSPCFQCNECNETPPDPTSEQMSESIAALATHLKDNALTKFIFTHINTKWPEHPKFNPNDRPAWEGLFDGFEIIVDPGCESSPV